jgi:hypothetical protein
VAGAAVTWRERWRRGRDWAAGAARAVPPKQIVIPRPLPPLKTAKAVLRTLDAAPATKAGVDTAKALKDGEYVKVMRILSVKTLTPDEWNNLGYALAWLAVEQRHPAYWNSAIEALEKSIESATGEALERAKSNLARVQRASGLA